jgi:hypothetical protein
LGGGDITVSATETDASAITRVYNAVGSIRDINLTAGDASNAQIQTFAVSNVPSESYAKFELETEKERRAASKKGAKEAGKLRQEGKEYIVQDGDVLLFKFNV